MNGTINLHLVDGDADDLAADEFRNLPRGPADPAAHVEHLHPRSQAHQQRQPVLVEAHGAVDRVVRRERRVVEVLAPAVLVRRRREVVVPVVAGQLFPLILVSLNFELSAAGVGCCASSEAAERSRGLTSRPLRLRFVVSSSSLLPSRRSGRHLCRIVMCMS